MSTISFAGEMLRVSVSLEPEPTEEGARVLLITITSLMTEHEWAARVALIDEARTEFTNVGPTELWASSHVGTPGAAGCYREDVAQVPTPSRQRSRSQDHNGAKGAPT